MTAVSALELFFQQLLNGLTIGMVYALIALGYTMVYGVMQLINFAHGEVFMVGAYLGLTGITLVSAIFLGAPFFIVFFLALVFSMLGTGALGAGIEKIAYKPLRGSPKLAALITSIGISFFLQNAVMLIYGTKVQSVPEIIPNSRLSFGVFSFSLIQILIFATSIGLMFYLSWFIRRTSTGKAMRATAENPEAARLMGISADKMICVTFVMGSVLAAVAGNLFGLYYGNIHFHDGYLLGLKAFAAAVFGGIGSIPGAMLGGILLGVFESLGAGYISSEWKDVFAFVLLAAVLLFKPSGILGEKTVDKV